jgi:hypothetical protein
VVVQVKPITAENAEILLQLPSLLTFNYIAHISISSSFSPLRSRRP